MIETLLGLLLVSTISSTAITLHRFFTRQPVTRGLQIWSFTNLFVYLLAAFAATKIFP